MRQKNAVLVLCLFFFLPYFANAEAFTFRADGITAMNVLSREVRVLFGNAEVRSNNFLLRADRIEIHGDDNRFIYCIGNAWAIDEERNIIFQADRLRYDRKLGIVRLEDNSTVSDIFTHEYIEGEQANSSGG